MKKAKGFTLIELMIVVAIIGILAAIAIPNFLRYQLRSKASERKINVEAIFKAEEAGRQREGGTYRTFTANVPAGTVGTTKIAWANTDYAVAGVIDWVVQGATYGQYNAASANNGTVVSVCGWTDIDGDSVLAADAVYQAVIGADGSASVNAPAAPCPTVNLSGGHTLAWRGLGAAGDPLGQAVTLSADNVF